MHTDKYYLLGQVYPFGLDLVSNYLTRQGHDVEIEYPFLPESDYKKNITDIISRTQPEFIGIGIRNLDTCMSCEQYGDFKGQDYQTYYFLPQVKQIVSEIEQAAPDVPVVVGGTAFTISPAAILKYLGLDYGIVKQGEEPFCQFIEAFPDKDKISQIPNMVYPSHEGYSINTCRPYRFTPKLALGHRDPKFCFAYETSGVPVQTKRGCNRKCSYCVEPLIEGGKFVFRNISSVIDELKAISQNLNEASTIFFVDTEFNVPDLTHCSELVKEILRQGLHDRFRFATQLIPKPFDSEFAQLLAKAGFSVVFSCESFSNAVLERNCVSYEEKDVVEAIELCDKAGIHCTVSLIFGLPGESHQTLDHSLERMKQYAAGPMRAYEYTVGGRVYQGTPLCRYVDKNSPSENLYGTKSPGYLSPYYYCAPASPFEVQGYIREAFPDLLCYDNSYDETTRESLAVTYLSDQGLWDKAVERFMHSHVAVRANIFDYLFRKLLLAQRQDSAKAIALSVLEDMDSGQGAVDPGKAEVVRFYLNRLGPPPMPHKR